jgi:ubiquinone/menaquinone biosynthesis C-methylase UbiE
MIVDSMHGHAAWSAGYDDAPNAPLALEQRTVEPWLAARSFHTVADVACGTGRWARWAAAAGALAIGMDLCREMLTGGRRPVPQAFIQADALRLPLRDACSDLVICAFAAGYIASPEPLIAELSRIARRGGHVLLTDVHPRAIASGWRRSFRHDGAEYEIRNHAHAIDDYIAASSRHQLALTRFDEPALGDPERAIFRQCGQGHRFESVRNTPAIFAFLWRRT